jgi:hypothetical protein
MAVVMAISIKTIQNEPGGDCRPQTIGGNHGNSFFGVS